jgi:SAM-dependent methyltransferase
LSNNWYTDFFTELPNTFWRAAIPPAATEAEVDFIVRVTGLRPGDHVVDVACGSGRHALPLAERGHRVTGVDVSTEAIDHARRQAVADATFVVGDMAHLPPDLAADVAICMGNAFGYLEHEDTVRFLADLRADVLVLDYGFVAESLLPGLTIEEEPMTIGGVEAVQENEYDPANSRWVTRFTFRQGDREHRGTSVQHVYTAAEVVRLVTGAGFNGVELYGDTDGNPFRLGSPRLILVASR